MAKLAGIELPNEPHRHEILSTEPLKPFLTPMVSVLSSGLYFSQSMRGEIVTGVTVEDHENGRVKMGSPVVVLKPTEGDSPFNPRMALGGTSTPNGL